MYCVECGFKIEDGYKFCPECGAEVLCAECPGVEEDRIERIADEVFLEHPLGKVSGVKEFMKRTGFDLQQSKSVMDERYNDPTNKDYIKQARLEERKCNNATFSDSTRQVLELQRMEKQAKKAQRKIDRRTVHCPRCKSTSISYGAKASWGRAFVGYGLAGDAGAVIGGMTGKRGYAVCMNCGKRWKI